MSLAGFQSFVKEFWSSATTPIFLTAVGLVACITIVTGPLGTYESLPLTVRIVYWTAITLSGAAVFIAVDLCVRPMVDDDQPVLRAVIIGAIMSIFYSPITMILCRLLTTEYREPTAPDEVVLIVFVSASAFYGFRHIFRARDSSAANTAAEGRLGVDNPLDVLSISADDHYIRIQTPKGEHRLLMRFSDAVERMEGYTGVIVHRSHWVAAHAVLSIQKDEGRYFAVLSNGKEVPVSRGRFAEVEEVLGISVLAA